MDYTIIEEYAKKHNCTNNQARKALMDIRVKVKFVKEDKIAQQRDTKELKINKKMNK